MSYKTINPATNEEIKSFDSISKEEVLEKIGLAHEAFGSWRQTSFDERKKVILAYAKQLRERTDEFAKLITLEMGKRIEEARYEITFCAEIAEFYANGAEEFLADEPVEVEDAEEFHPVGGASEDLERVRQVSTARARPQRRHDLPRPRAKVEVRIN